MAVEETALKSPRTIVGRAAREGWGAALNMAWTSTLSD